MKLVYYRVFVAKASQLSLLDDNTLSKPELINKAFTSSSEPIYFNSGDRKFAFVVHKVAEPYIFASLAKQSQVKIQHSPEEDFETESIETWPNVPIIINTSPEPDTGQSLAVELNKSVFEFPHVQIRKLVAELNSRILKSLGYEMAIHPITEQDDFWQTVEQHEGNIKAVEFEFSAPNLFGTNDSLNNELREARDSFGMTKTAIKIENSEGELKVPANSAFINEGIGYISEGGGEYKIHLTNRRTVTSEESVRSKVVEETDLKIAASSKETLKDFCDTLFSWLKH